MLSEMCTSDCGESHLLVEVDELDDVMALYAAIRAKPFEGLVELVPAARTLLIEYDRRVTTAVSVRAALKLVRSVKHQRALGEQVHVVVTYDGADLDEIALMFDMDHDQVVAWHTEQVWTVAFSGFAPGFGYLVGTGESRQVPRLARPRTAVPAGAIALAGEFTGIYPRSSPGGWCLIGRTDAALWDLNRQPPALLRPGVAVRFAAA